MPSLFSFFSVVLVWLFRAWSLRLCAYLILAAALASCFSTSLGSEIHQDRTTRHREKATSSKVATRVSGGALLTKNLISAGSRTLRATTKWNLSPGRPSASLTVIMMCLHSHTMGPFWPSVAVHRVG